MTTTLTSMSLEEFFDIIGDRTPSVLLVGYDPERCLYVHFQPLNDEQLRSRSTWAGSADLRLELKTLISDREIKDRAHELWPEVRCFDFHCTCCTTDDLVEINCCGYCEELDDHTDGCPLLFEPSEPRRADDPCMQAHYLFMRGYRAGFNGHRCGEKTATGRLGYQQGRKNRKNHHKRIV